ncbi:MAG: polymer-forming cytoskeletal protein [Longimicrobiales bacterium]|nr:polymer-forming cytoskeletal protein [Longimicrobiales bacterium]
MRIHDDHEFGGGRHETPGALSTLLLLTFLTLAGCHPPDPWSQGVLLHPDGDLLAADAEVALAEDVRGDVMAAGRHVRFAGHAGGSYLGAAGDQEISGRVTGSVRAAGGTVVVDAVVGRNLTIVGGGVELVRGAVVDGNAYVAGGRVRLMGRVGGDVYVGGRDVHLDGPVEGDVRVEAGSLTVGPDAVIGGELRYRVRDDGLTTISPQATLVGGARALEPRGSDEGGAWSYVLRVLAFLVTGVVLVTLFPVSFGETIDEVADAAVGAMGLGLLWLVLVPPAAFLLAVTVVGIPLALLLLLLYGLSLYLAPVVTGLWLGGEMLRRPDPPDAKGAAGAFLVGGGVVAVGVLLPWVGFLVRLAAVVLGVGAVILTLRHRHAIPQRG